MSDDILDWLKHWPTYPSVKKTYGSNIIRAADEIERLRAEVEKLQKYYAELNETNAKLLVLERERAEKLRAENEKLLRRSKMWFKVAQDLGHQDTFLPDIGDSDD